MIIARQKMRTKSIQGSGLKKLFSFWESRTPWKKFNALLRTVLLICRVFALFIRTDEIDDGPNQLIYRKFIKIAHNYKICCFTETVKNALKKCQAAVGKNIALLFGNYYSVMFALSSLTWPNM